MLSLLVAEFFVLLIIFTYICYLIQQGIVLIDFGKNRAKKICLQEVEEYKSRIGCSDCVALVSIENVFSRCMERFGYGLPKIFSMEEISPFVLLIV